MKLANPNFSPEVMEFVQDAVDVGNLAREMRASGQLKAWLKADKTIVTNADFAVQLEMTRRIERRIPNYRSIFEEDMLEMAPELAVHEFKPDEFADIFSEPDVIISDAIDYTWGLWKGVSGWGTQWKWMRKGEFFCSVFYAPEDLGGFVCAAEKDRGTWYFEGTIGRWARARSMPLLVGERPSASYSRAISGTSWFNRFFVNLKTLFEDIPIVAAGIGSAWAACGKTDLHILAPRPPWDWAPYMLLAQEAGKYCRLFRCYTERGTQMFDQADIDSFNPHKEPVGVLIGSPELVKKAGDLMERVMNGSPGC